MTRKCEECGKSPHFGLPNGSRTHCKKHKLPEMINVGCRKCKECERQPSYGLLGGLATHCVIHKSPNMVDVVSKKCKECNNQPSYGIQGQLPTHCVIHKSPNMIDVVSKKCIHNKTRCFECTPLKLLKYYCRGRIRHFFPKHPNPEELLGTIDYQIVYDHIKSQMTNDMTCLNYGCHSNQWSLDHIIPILFDNPTDEEMIQRFHYSNLQPLFGNNQKQNIVRLEDIYVLANHWDTLTPELQVQVHHIRHNDDTLLYGILPVQEKKQKFKLILKQSN